MLITEFTYNGHLVEMWNDSGFYIPVIEGLPTVVNRSPELLEAASRAIAWIDLKVKCENSL